MSHFAGWITRPYFERADIFGDHAVLRDHGPVPDSDTGADITVTADHAGFSDDNRQRNIGRQAPVVRCAYDGVIRIPNDGELRQPAETPYLDDRARLKVTVITQA